MKLLTKEIEATLPKLKATESQEDALAVVKFFTPFSNWTWYVIEGEREGDDFVFFGLVDGHEEELGYFRLSELESVTGPGGLKIERDLYWRPKPWRECQKVVSK